MVMSFLQGEVSDEDIEAALMRELLQDDHESHCDTIVEKLAKLEENSSEPTALQNFIDLSKRTEAWVEENDQILAECSTLLEQHSEPTTVASADRPTEPLVPAHDLAEDELAALKQQQALLAQWRAVTHEAVAALEQRPRPAISLNHALVIEDLPSPPSPPPTAPVPHAAEDALARAHARYMEELQQAERREAERLEHLRTLEEQRRVEREQGKQRTIARITVPLQARCRAYLVRCQHSAAVTAATAAYRERQAALRREQMRLKEEARRREEEEKQRLAALEEQARQEELAAMRAREAQRQLEEEERLQRAQEEAAAAALARQQRMDAEQRAREQKELERLEQERQRQREKEEAAARARELAQRQAEEEARLRQMIEEEKRAAQARADQERREAEQRARAAAEQAALDRERERRLAEAARMEAARRQAEEEERQRQAQREAERVRRALEEQQARARMAAAAAWRETARATIDDAARDHIAFLEHTARTLTAAAPDPVPPVSSSGKTHRRVGRESQTEPTAVTWAAAERDLFERVRTWTAIRGTSERLPPSTAGRVASAKTPSGPARVTLDDAFLRDQRVESVVELRDRDISAVSTCMKLASVTRLCLADNAIATWKAEATWPKLTSLCMHHNALCTVAELPSVPLVHASRNRVTVLPSASNSRTSSASGPNRSAVVSLNVDENALTSFAEGVNYPGLAVLSARGNSIISTRGLSSGAPLLSVSLAGNRLHACELSLRLLVELDLSGNGLREAPLLRDMVLLESLNLSRNSLTSLALPAAVWLPRLHTLRAADNMITTVASLASCLLLRSLDLANNRISDADALIESLTFCPLLTTVELTGNPVPTVSLRPHAPRHEGVVELLKLLLSHEREISRQDYAAARAIADCCEPVPAACVCVAVPPLPLSLQPRPAASLPPSASPSPSHLSLISSPAARVAALFEPAATCLANTHAVEYHKAFVAHIAARRQLLQALYDALGRVRLHSMTRAQAATIIQAHWRGHLLRSRLAAVLTSSYHEHDDEFEFEDVDMGDFDFDESKFDAEFSELPDTARPRRAPKQAFATPAPSQPPSSPPHTRAWTQASSSTASTVTSPSKSSKVDSLANEWGFDKATAALMLKRARHLGPRAQHKGPRPAPPRHAPVPAPAPVHTHMHAHAHPAAARPAPPSQADSPAETRVQSCWDHPPPSKKPLAMRAYPVLPDIAPGSSRSSSADSVQRPRGK